MQRHALAPADIALMNAEEAKVMQGVADLDDALQRLVELGPGIVIATSSNAGSVAATGVGAVRIPAVPVDVVFDIGVGDAFHAGFLAVWRAGTDPLAAERFASHAASVKVGREPIPELLPTREVVVAAMERAGGG